MDLGAAHVDIKGNEMADTLAKQELKGDEVEVALCKLGGKALIGFNMPKKWQHRWDTGTKGRHFHRTEGKVDGVKTTGRKRREEAVFVG